MKKFTGTVQMAAGGYTFEVEAENAFEAVAKIKAAYEAIQGPPQTIAVTNEEEQSFVAATFNYDDLSPLGGTSEAWTWSG